MSEAAIDFNQAIFDINGKEMEISDPSEEQSDQMQNLQMIVNHSGSSFDQAAGALQELQALQRKVRSSYRLGQVCANALTSKDEKADGTQMLKRTLLAQKIMGSVDEDEFAVVELNSKLKNMITDRAAEIYKLPIFYARIYQALEGKLPESLLEED